jgi:uncharacterized protein (TIGR03437 family)
LFTVVGGNRIVRAKSGVVLWWMLFCSLGHAQVNILTANGGNSRTNSNLQETQLAPSNVNPTNFGKLAVFPVDGQVYAQPLYVSGIAINGATHNVLYVATQHNTIFAFDADSTAPQVLWQTNLGASVPAALLFGPYGDIANEVGILGTPAIDLQRGMIYAVSDNFEGGAPVFYLHALDLATGNEQLGGPVTISASVPGSGSGGDGSTVAFNPLQHIQRPGLLLANGAVYVAFGSHGDQSPYHGWLMSFDAGNLTHQLAVYMSTPNGDGGSFWQSGRGPAADSAGNVYAITGNGDYDGVQNFGESLLKFSPTLNLTGSFAPSNEQSLSNNDADIAAGPALINDRTYAGADKAGNLYLLDTTAMGQPGAQNGNAFQVFSVSPSSIFNFAVWNRGDNALLYIQGHADTLKCFQFTTTGFNSIPLSQSSSPVNYVRLGMTLSANGTQDGTGILWEITGNFNDASTNATLHAYDAGNLANELWNSDMNSAHDSMGPIVKFVSPTVANGKVYAPSLNNSVMIYGLYSSGIGQPQPPVLQAVASAASYETDGLSPGEIVAIFGSNLGPTTPAGMQLGSDGMVTTSLADTEVFFDGIPAPMVWASAGQVNAVVPFGVSNTPTQVQVQYQDRMSDPFPMPVAPAVPGIFTADSSGIGQAIVLNQDGSVNSANNPAPAGSVITLYATGAGQFNPPLSDGFVVYSDAPPVPALPVTARVGGRGAVISYAGAAPGAVAGVLQVNLQIPTGTPSGPAVPVTLTIGGATSQSNLTIAVQ